MEDVPRAPADVSPVLAEPATIPTLDGWIESLMSCKQLAESDVQRLCEKVQFPSCLCEGPRRVGRVLLQARPYHLAPNYPSCDQQGNLPMLTTVLVRRAKFFKMNPTFSRWYVSHCIFRVSFWALALTWLEMPCHRLW